MKILSLIIISIIACGCSYFQGQKGMILDGCEPACHGIETISVNQCDTVCEKVLECEEIPMIAVDICIVSCKNGIEIGAVKCVDICRDGVDRAFRAGDI